MWNLYKRFLLACHQFEKVKRLSTFLSQFSQAMTVTLKSCLEYQEFLIQVAILIFLKVYLSLSVRLCVHIFEHRTHMCTCTGVLLFIKARRGQRISWRCSYRLCQPLCRCWELNCSHLQKQQMFLNLWAISPALSSGHFYLAKIMVDKTSVFWPELGKIEVREKAMLRVLVDLV